MMHSAMHKKRRRGLLAFALAGGAAACGAPDGGGDGTDYLTPDLRTAVEQLKADVAANPTDETTIAERARILDEWIDAYALGGGEVGLEGPRVRLQATLPPTGEAALAQGATLDRLVRQFTLHDEPGALGDLTAESLGPFEARSHQTIRQTWTAGTRAVETGGGFWVARHFNMNYGAFQTDDPAGEGYVTIAASDGGAVFEPDVYMARGPHGGFRAPAPALVFRLVSGRLDPGETVTITYGDTSGGGPGLLMTGTSSARMPLPLYVDLDASGEWRPLPILPFVVSGTRVAGVHGFAPSIVEPGEPFELSVRAEDAFFNRATGAIPAFEVLVDGEVRAATPAGTDAISLVPLTLDEPGPHWIDIRSEDGSISGVANPILVVENPERRIFWGDTHGHSGYAEGIGTIDFFMTFARDDARLDFVTHSEHDVWLDDAEWELSKRAVEEFDDPGRFIPYLGWEWTRPARFGGHHNVLYRDTADRTPVSALEYPTLSRLYQGLHARYDPADVLVIPHAHNPGDYRQSDPRLEPLIEMMSMHGTFNWFVRQYLSHGHRVGLIAASDDHLSHPGYSAPNRDSLAQRGGLGAVLAPERSRDAIFDAMKQRRTYATTGDRIILDVAVNGVPMGQEAEYSDVRAVEGRVVGTVEEEQSRFFKAVGEELVAPGYASFAATTQALATAASDYCGSAYLKISDGCNAPCAFCTIPSFKGKLRSRDARAVLAEAERLVQAGAKELVVVAQDTTDYGRDRAQSVSLAQLLRLLCRRCGSDLRWLRVMYAYPGHVTDDLIDAMAQEERIVPYLDIPLQHGDPTVLRRMRRPHRLELVQDHLAKLRQAMPDVVIRTTFIVGFPGETDAAFANLLAFVEDSRFDRVGAFQFSPEPGTPSHDMPDQVPDALKEERWHRLMACQQPISLARNQAQLGRQLDVLIEGQGQDEAGQALLIGRSYRDAPEVDGLVLIPDAPDAQPGTMLSARITGALPYDLIGEVLSPVTFASAPRPGT